jgi:regulator of RNase E activity RraA
MVQGRDPNYRKFRIEALEINGPVTLGRIQVWPGDLIIADDSGVCAVPADKVEEVLAEVKKIVDMEAQMEALVLSGASIAELKELHKQRYK